MAASTLCILKITLSGNAFKISSPSLKKSIFWYFMKGKMILIEYIYIMHTQLILLMVILLPVIYFFSFLFNFFFNIQEHNILLSIYLTTHTTFLLVFILETLPVAHRRESISN